MDGKLLSLTADSKTGAGYTVQDDNAPVNIGRHSGNNAYCFDGLIDEVRISNIAKNVSWINVSYLNQRTKSTFLSIGTEIERGTLPTVISCTVNLPLNNAVELYPTLTVFNITISNTNGEDMDVTFDSNDINNFRVFTGLSNGTYAFSSPVFDMFGYS
jgi:hypothetical protein